MLLQCSKQLESNGRSSSCADAAHSIDPNECQSCTLGIRVLKLRLGHASVVPCLCLHNSCDLLLLSAAVSIFPRIVVGSSSSVQVMAIVDSIPVNSMRQPCVAVSVAAML